jgi:outer membrane protein assembly factor BamB
MFRIANCLCFALAASLCLTHALPAKPKAKPAPIAAPAASTVWSQFKADARRSGFSPRALRLPLKQAWRFESSKGLYSSPAVADGLVVFGAEDRHAYGLRLATGAQAWKTKLEERVYGSGPLIDDGKAYLCSVDGRLNALNLSDGSKVWQFQAPAQEGLFGGVPPAFSSPLKAGGLLVFGADDGKAYGVRAKDARMIWQAQLQGKVHDNSAAQGDRYVILATQDGLLYALEPGSGQIAWTFKAGKMFNTTPACAYGKVYAGNGDKNLYCLDENTGKELWHVATGYGITSSPAIHPDGIAVFGSGDKKVYAVDAHSGKIRWTFATGDYVLSSPILAGKQVIVGSFDKILYILDLDSGKELGRHAMQGPIYATPALVGGRLLVADKSGLLVCLSESE